ncbi:cardiolipin synthase [Aerococcus sp. UMB7834]|uniref:cardiolipin synthase n=1 Tax=Aerococcus sp. UMB7834 TaxID=3046342 RepID=UPI00254EBF13|nr:cardiolipin synthase [Aerococcus sp. UMB7834]MDK6804460.1 cardiolipin synthase [Aerococcus sp. UMB7834]
MLETTQTVLANLFSLFIIANTILAVFTVFRQRRPVTSIWAWLLVLILLPGFGFILYFFVGRRLSDDKIFSLSQQQVMGMSSLVDKYIDEDGMHRDLKTYPSSQQSLIKLFYQTDDALLTNSNDLDLYVDGKAKMHQLLEDIRQAKDHIHIQYYIFSSDEMGSQVVEALAERAEAGVKVRLLYDPLGSRKLSRKDINRLEEAGAETSGFFSRGYWLVDLRLNFRNHRKLVIIDGDLGYIGGFNIAKEYIGRGPLGYWRDTHLRVRGEAVQAMQTRFIRDWCASMDYSYDDFLEISDDARSYFPEVNEADHGHVPMQIVSSGPEDDTDQIKLGYIQLINSAEHTLYIQTPYFIPDESVYEALEIAALSGVEVHLMIPCKPDHPFVYRATEYYCREIIEKGVQVHRYDKGFLHSKVVIADDEVASVGTANFDIRSFSLNFEVNAFVYDKDLVAKLKAAYQDDLKVSTTLDAAYFDQQSWFKKLRQNLSRLLSPIL